MNLIKDDKDIRLDTPEAVKEALLAGADLYNPESGEFWWLYNMTDSIATTTIPLDDPNLLAVIDNPDFDLYENIVGDLNYTGYITDSIETIIEDGEENPPLIDPRDEVFEQIASEDGWVVATPENVRTAVRSYQDLIAQEAAHEKEAAENAAWKEKNVLIDRNGDDALVMRPRADGTREFVVAHGYDDETGRWSHGTYYDSIASAAADLEGRSISTANDVILADFWCREDIAEQLEGQGIPTTDANIDLVIGELGLDGKYPYSSYFMESLAMAGNEMISEAVSLIAPNDPCAEEPAQETSAHKVSLKKEADTMRAASQTLSEASADIARDPAPTADHR